MAPEVLFKQDYSYESDFYALGVMIHELAVGKRPYEGKNRTEIRDELIKRDINLSGKDFSEENAYLADLINKLLKKNRNERLGIKGIHEIKEHKYFSDVKWGKLEKKELKPPFVPHVISETKEYLDEIALFNQMHQEADGENTQPLGQEQQFKFAEYDYERRAAKTKGKNLKGLKKGKRISQKHLLC